MFEKAYLKNEEGMVISVFTNRNSFDFAVSGEIEYVHSWDVDYKPIGSDFFASVTVKWDGCSHFTFLGEDYKDEKSPDGYYHICGINNYIDFMRQLHFAYEVMVEIVGIERIDEKEELQELRKLGLLEGYTIEYI